MNEIKNSVLAACIGFIAAITICELGLVGYNGRSGTLIILPILSAALTWALSGRKKTQS